MSGDATEWRWSARLIYFAGGGIVTAGLALAVLTALDRPAPDPEPARLETESQPGATTPGGQAAFSFYEALDRTEPDPAKFMKLPGAALPGQVPDEVAGSRPPGFEPAAQPAGSGAPAPEPKPKPAPAVRTAAPAPPPSTPKSAARAAGFAVQLGAFGDRNAAKALVQRLAQQGVVTSVAEMRTADGRTLYRVRTARFADRAAAAAAAERISARAGLAAIVVREPAS